MPSTYNITGVYSHPTADYVVKAEKTSLKASIDKAQELMSEGFRGVRITRPRITRNLPPTPVTIP